MASQIMCTTGLVVVVERTPKPLHDGQSVKVRFGDSLTMYLSDSEAAQLRDELDSVLAMQKVPA